MNYEVIKHYGTPRHSGRYPWGSGKNPYQNSSGFLTQIKELEEKGLTETQIREALGFRSTTQLRALRRIALNQERAAKINEAVMLKEKKWSNVAIAEKMGVNESVVRGYLKAHEQGKVDKVTATADRLRLEVETKGAIDVGLGVNTSLGVNKTTMDTALEMLYAEGYRRHNVKVKTVAGNMTSRLVLAKPEGEAGAQWRELYDDPSKIALVEAVNVDSQTTALGLEVKPKPFSSKRLAVRYGPEGGSEKDGVIEIRRGVPDLDMGNNRYAQARIAIDGTHYLKGMVVYNDNMPPGVDMIFNTDKPRGTPKDELFKKLKADKIGIIDQDNPFGASIEKQFYKIDKNGNRVATSVINIVNEEGRWDEWSRTLSSQMLSKQSPAMAKQQLELQQAIKRAELDDILALSNPSVKQKLLQSFADNADSAAVHLKAAHLPRQRNSVILPVNSLKDNEVYAPQFNQGESVVLIRHPHGGTFEIPELRVNNRNKDAKSIIGNSTDAIGINSNVAARLSGADFDGDTVLVIPQPASGPGRVKTTSPLEGLADFNPKTAFPGYEGMPKLTDSYKQKLMGDVSNLITDMTIKGASEAELARAVRHSMVVIDAEKHNLNWRLSKEKNAIDQLKAAYQKEDGKGGAATIISRAKSPLYVDARVPRKASEGGAIDPKTGKLVFTAVEPKTYTRINKETGLEEVVTVSPGKTKSSKMRETDDAMSLVSKSQKPIEIIYAQHANNMKALANEARREMVAVKTVPYSPSANKAYAKEVARLTDALAKAQSNAPLERQAQSIASVIVKDKMRDNPHWEDDDIKKARWQALKAARKKVGAEKDTIIISDKEWEAIQAGAISKSRLDEILTHSDLDRVKELATPRTSTGIPPARLARAQSMYARGYTQAEIAAALGVSVSTIANALKGG